MVKILLVEDNKENYEMMMRRLRGRGFEVTLAVDGEEAVEKARLEEPDLILMDIRLPGQDGYAATRQIRELSDDGVADVPIIALTAHALTDDKDRALAAGCNDHHAKPVAFDQLVRQMETLLPG